MVQFTRVCSPSAHLLCGFTIVELLACGDLLLSCARCMLGYPPFSTDDLYQLHTMVKDLLGLVDTFNVVIL